MQKSDLPAAIEAAERHVHAADGSLQFAATRLRQRFARKRRPLKTVAIFAGPLLGLLWLMRSRSRNAQRISDYQARMEVGGPKNLLMAAAATVLASRRVWQPLLFRAIDEVRRINADRAMAGHPSRPARRTYARPTQADRESVAPGPYVTPPVPASQSASVYPTSASVAPGTHATASE